MSILLQTLVSTLRFSAPPKTRSPHWPVVRAEHLLKFPTCAACGSKKKLEVHHKLPFHDDPSKELDPDNLITLCESTSDGIICHLCIGHDGNYKDYNPTVEADAARMLEMLKNKKE